MENETFHKYSIELLECQVELILKSLEFYLNAYNQFSDNNKNIERNILTDTYNQILNECKDGINSDTTKTYNKILGQSA